MRFVLLLPSGWCPIAANLLAQVEDQIAEQPGAQTCYGRLSSARGSVVAAHVADR
jgi:hypothetical protein